MTGILTIADASRAIAAGALSPVTLTEACLARIRAQNPVLDAVVCLTEERAMADAARAAREIAAGRKRGPLHGIPYGLKDIIDTAGIRTTCHSRIHLERVPEHDAEVARRLAEAGGVLVGKLATHEFATGGPAFDLPFPPARNPWDPRRFTGGSSSGSGAAVGAGLLPLALGTDTGGSIRLPAAYCGIAGLKPSYGRVSRRGVAPLSFSLDHVGPLAWTVEDCAIALQVLAGYDPGDPGSADLPVPDYLAGLTGEVSGLRLGYVRSFHANGADPAMVAGLDAAVQALARLGMEVVEVELPPLDLFQACARAISGAEAYAVHEQDLRTRPELYARVTRERLSLGAYVTGPDYVQAQRLRRELNAAVATVLERVDVLASAVIPTPAPLIEDVEDGPWRHRAPITGPFNITGEPALSLCCGYSADGLPLALQLSGRMFEEATVLRVGHAYELATPWRDRRPALAAAAGVSA
jgi:aspartyl-tRNA(Asn)/glutamyl-tRNA(Gln) amidotransferase subunit A